MTQNSQTCDQALDQLNAMVHKVKPTELHWPTPDDGFTVAGLLDHVAGAVTALAVALRPDDPAPEGDWKSRYQALKEALAEVGDPDRMVQLPFAEMPAEVAMGVMTGEFATHSWDLAVSLGVKGGLDDGVGEAAYAVMRTAVPADGRVPGGPFGAVIVVDDSAPIYDRLAGWTGRDPHWKSSVKTSGKH